MNAKYSIQYLPWARGYEMVKKGKAELTFPYIKTEAREKEVIYAKDYLMQTNLYIITNLQPQNENKKSLSDFKNNIFCNPIGYAFEPVIKELVDKKEMQIKIVTEFD